MSRYAARVLATIGVRGDVRAVVGYADKQGVGVRACRARQESIPAALAYGERVALRLERWVLFRWEEEHE